MKFPKIRNPLDYIYPERDTIRRYLVFCGKHPLLIIAFLAVMTFFGVWGTLHLYGHVDTSMTALLPEYYRSVQTLNKIDQEGSKLSEMIIAQGDNPDELVAYAKDLKQALEESPLIFQIKIKRDVISKKYALLVLKDNVLYSIRDRIQKLISKTAIRKSGFFIDLEEGSEGATTSAGVKENLGFEDIKENVPGFFAKEGTREEYLMSRSEKMAIISIFPNNPPSNLALAESLYKVLYEKTERLKKDYPKVKPWFYGPYRKRMDEFRLIRHDANLVGTLTMLAVIMSVVFYFRQFFPVIVISLPLALGLFWTMGIADLMIGKLNTITAFLIGILGGLGVDFCIYLYSRYLEYRKAGESQLDALVDSVSLTGRAAFTSGLNTALVFISLTLADFKGFSEFGLIAGVGLIICYLAIYLFLPAFIIWFEGWGWVKAEPAPTFFGLPWPRLTSLIPGNMKRFPFSRLLVILAVGIIVAFGIIFSRIQFEYDFGKLRSDMITYKDEEALLDDFNLGGRRGNAALLIMNSREDIPAVEQAIQKKIESDKGSPTLRGFLSINDFWPPPEVQMSRMKTVNEIRELMQHKVIKNLKGEQLENAREFMTYLDVEPYPLEAISADIRQNFSPRQGPVGSYGYVLARYEIRTKDGRDAMKFAEDAREIKTSRGSFYASSQEIVFADILGLMLHESRLTVLIAICLISGFVWLDFWSVPKTLLVLVPVATGTMLTMILLYSFGGKITFFNMIVVPMIIGMGEDSAVHLYHRYVHEGRGSICKTMKTTGTAVWMATGTNVIGFIGLVFSHHKGLQSIGFLASAGLLGCLICSLLVLPAMVQVLEDLLPEFPGKSEY